MERIEPNSGEVENAITEADLDWRDDELFHLDLPSGSVFYMEVCEDAPVLRN